ncbi:SH3 domain-containing protein [Mesobacillus maritimus]|uniref:SH3 domain-containing protein n=1 Tax=Mesobacillus maritimus TaxID=1643336 RepID=UPI00203FD773|nr:SH3 domain-containing protein [Mesobacillus maritimus]MCM3669951.1 SH3 domain-containing protein [Mesobacillus maritimus]
MLNKKMALLFLCLLLIITGSIEKAGPAEANNGFVTITASNLNVRGGPGLSYSVVSKVDNGEKYPILDQQGDWIQIGLTGGKKGWVAEWFTSKDVNAQNGAVNGTTGTVRADSLRVRTGPGTSYPLAGSLSQGQKVTIQEMNGTWVKIQASSLEGWVANEFLQTSQSQESIRQTGKNTYVTTSGLNVRSQPSLSSSIVGNLDQGTMVTVLSESAGWSEVLYNGTSSWVSSQYLDNNKPTQASRSTTNTAKATVSATSLYVRDEGNLNGNVVGQVFKGQSFNILEEKNNWIKVEYQPGKTGWAASWFFDQAETTASVTSAEVNNQTLTILSDGTNIRSDSGTHGSVVHRADKGETFEVVGVQGDWYQIKLGRNQTGYVAGWIVSLNGSGTQIEKPGPSAYTKKKTIVIDPGHGGNDSGTIGARGTYEKDLTIKTARLLANKLRAAGAEVIMTRNTDTYVSLDSRTTTSHYHNADAFISLHYDSIDDRSVRGMTTYYYYGKDLASAVHKGAINQTKMNDRGVRYGNYHVIRENQQKAALIELGYLSNPAEETLVNSDYYQQAVAEGIYEGLARFFKME